MKKKITTKAILTKKILATTKNFGLPDVIDIDANNKLIAEFMNYLMDNEAVVVNSKGYSYEQLKFHLSWDWLMPAIQKWDNLNINKIMYVELSNNLDDVITRNYNITDAYKQLIKNITWYNKKK